MKTRLSRPRWVRWGLRTLVISIALLAIGLGWLTRRAERIQNFKAAIEEHNGEVFFGWEEDPVGRGTRGDDKVVYPPWPKWTLSVLGPDFVTGVDVVAIAVTEVDDELLAAIEDVGGCRVLRINDDGVPQIWDETGRQVRDPADAMNGEWIDAEFADALAIQLRNAEGFGSVEFDWLLSPDSLELLETACHRHGVQTRRTPRLQFVRKLGL